MHGSGESRRAKDRVRSAWQLVGQFLQLLRPFRGAVIAILASVTISTVLGLLPPAGTKFIIDYGLSGKPLPPAWESQFPALANPKTLLLTTVIVVSIVTVLKLLVHIWGRWYATRISKQIQLNLRRRVFEHAVRLPLHRVQELRSGGVASILREDGGSVGELVFGMLFNPWRAIIQLLGSLVILAWVDWTLLLGAIVLLPAVFLTHRAWINRIRPQFRVIRKQRELIDASATESFAGMRIVRAFSRQKREAARFTTENNLMARQELYAWWWMRIVEMVWEALIPMASAALLFYGGWRVLEGHMTVGDLMMFLVYLLMLLEPLATLASSATQFQNSLSGLDRVLDLLGEAREMPSSPDSLRADKAKITGRIAFENVSFTYPGNDVAALNDVNLAVTAATRAIARATRAASAPPSAAAAPRTHPAPRAAATTAATRRPASSSASSACWSPRASSPPARWTASTAWPRRPRTPERRRTRRMPEDPGGDTGVHSLYDGPGVESRGLLTAHVDPIVYSP